MFPIKCNFPIPLADMQPHTIMPHTGTWHLHLLLFNNFFWTDMDRFEVIYRVIQIRPSPLGYEKVYIGTKLRSLKLIQSSFLKLIFRFYLFVTLFEKILQNRKQVKTKTLFLRYSMTVAYIYCMTFCFSAVIIQVKFPFC